MGFNPADLLKLKGAANKFNENHTKFLPFINEVKGTMMTPGTVIEITVTDSNGEEVDTNLMVQESDLELFKLLIEMLNSSVVEQVNSTEDDPVELPRLADNLIVQKSDNDEDDEDDDENEGVVLSEELFDRMDKIRQVISEMGSREELERSGLLQELNSLTGLKWDGDLHEVEEHVQNLEQLKDALENLNQNIQERLADILLYMRNT